MVAPGFLANPEVRRWLNGVEPAWTMLEFDSFNALHDEPSANNKAIRLESNLTATEVSASAVAVNTMLLLRRAPETGGLKLTATGNLCRAVVKGMLGIELPDYNKASPNASWKAGADAVGSETPQGGNGLGLCRRSFSTSPSGV
jgi:hypothetical protein